MTVVILPINPYLFSSTLIYLVIQKENNGFVAETVVAIAKLIF